MSENLYLLQEIRLMTLSLQGLFCSNDSVAVAMRLETLEGKVRHALVKVGAFQNTAECLDTRDPAKGCVWEVR